MKDLIAYCGLDCEVCEARIATINNDDKLRDEVAKEWSELNGVEITPEMINCTGCRIDGVKTPYCESLCPIRQCAKDRYETCGDCSEIARCEKVKMILDNNSYARSNLNYEKMEELNKEMIKDDYVIRLERKEDHPAVENLIREAFWNVYRPGCLEHYLITRLRVHPDFVGELDFVMEKDGQIIGQNVFVKANIKADDGRNIPILTMGPICITPELKRQGYGKILLDHSLEKAAGLGFGAVCFEGNINFYGKSGFTFASEFGLRYHGLPEDADASFFLCKELIPGYLSGITGEYAPPEVYLFPEEEAEEFDKKFPHKEKLKLPGQLF